LGTDSNSLIITKPEIIIQKAKRIKLSPLIV
jgi:hypothetical protein